MRKRSNRAQLKRSPESVFLRTGRVLPEIDLFRARRLAVRFLSMEWRKQALKRNNRHAKILPLFHERIHGGKLPEQDRKAIDSQIEFVVGVFCSGISLKKRQRLATKLKRMVGDEMLSIQAIIDPGLGSEPFKRMHSTIKQLHTYLQKRGHIYPAMTFHTGKSNSVYFSKGWREMREAETTPVHEAVHLLCGLKLIKIDVPFAQAADRLYGLEEGIFKPNPRFKKPTLNEFERQPGINPKTGMYNEPQWTYSVGNRIGQWLFENLPKEKRWAYLRERCNGLGHLEALKKLSETQH